MANLTLDGLERLLKETFRRKEIQGKAYNPKVTSCAMPMTSSSPDARKSCWKVKSSLWSNASCEEFGSAKTLITIEMYTSIMYKMRVGSGMYSLY